MILADFLAPERLSIQLKAFSSQGLSFFQQALNTINLFCRRIGEAIQIMNREENLVTDKVIAHLQPRYSAANLMAKARQELTEIDQKIAAYIVEATLRGLNISPLIQKAYQRNTKIGHISLEFNADKLLEAEEE